MPTVIEWMDNKVLLYSTENYIQRAGINLSREECKKNVHMLCNSHFACSRDWCNIVDQLYFNKLKKENNVYAAVAGWRVLCQLVKWVDKRLGRLCSLKKWIWLCWVLAVACGVLP